MKRLLVIFLLTLVTNVSLAQSGWGYVNYTSYKTHAGNGSQNQYPAFAYDAAGFDNMFNTANSNTTIFRTGEVTLQAMASGSSTVPRWSSDYFGYKFEFWFVPQETGTYRFGINSDDASDLSIGGTMVSTYYGGHGASAYQYGTINLVAGQRYFVVARMQEFGGGEAFLLHWSRPSAPNTYSYWNNEVTNIANEPTKKARMNFDFGSTLDETKFSIGSALSSTGWVDITNQLDSNKVGDGYKANLVGGQVEYAYVTNYTDTTMLLNLDLRTFGNTPHADVKSIKLLDAYEGNIKYVNSNAYWVVYTIPKQTFTTGTYIRDMGAGSYAFKCDITYTNNNVYKPQSVVMTTTNTLSTLYNTIVTVADVYLAFRELQNGGIFGNQSGNEFTYGIQYKNADIDDNDIFNEADCFALLQHLTGRKNLVDTFNLRKTLKLIPQTTYNTIGKSNWTTFPSYLGDKYNFDINTGKGIDTFYIKGTWKGDVNLSHSATPPSNGITTMSANFGTKSVSSDVEFLFDTEVVGDSIVVDLKVRRLQELAAIQFNLNFDKLINYSSTTFQNTSAINFARPENGVVSIGSINTSGQPLENMIYKISFKSNTPITNILGLISISNYEAIDVSGKNLKVKIL